MENKFIFDEYNDVIGVENEKTIILHKFSYYLNDEISILITKDLKKDSNGEEYFNLYIIDPHFKKEPLNCLHEQIPLSAMKEEQFNKLFCEMEFLKHILWFKYSTNEKVLSFNIEAIED